MKIKNSRFLSTVLWCVTFSIVLFGIYAFNIDTTIPPLVIPKQESAVNLNEQAMATLSMGNKRMLASLLWVQTLLESDIDHYKKNDLNSWMYLRFKSIITIDPKFYEAYLYGGQYLSVIKDDILGANDILEAGAQVFPEDFWMNYFLGFHAYFEMGDNERAFKYYNRILNNPLTQKRIPFLPSLMARLKVEKGEYKDAYLLMKGYFEKIPQGPLKEKFKQNLYALKAKIDLDCLNASLGNLICEKQDWDGFPYLKNEKGKYFAQKNWQIFKTYKIKNRSNQSKKEKR